MRLSLFLSVALVLAFGVFASCSNSASYTPKYKSSVNASPTDSADVVDITAQAAALPTGSTVKKLETAPEEVHKRVVSPGNLPKCVDQLAGAQKVWEKMKEVNDYYGDQVYKYDLGDRCYINGNPMDEMGAVCSPVPLLTTWDTAQIEDVKDVKAWGTHGTMVRVKGRRRAPEGNWYLVYPMNTGLNQVRGWVPEKLISSTKAIPSGGFASIGIASCGGGGGG